MDENTFTILNIFSILVFDFCLFSIPDIIHYIYFPILFLEKEPVFPILMFSAKQEN